MSEELEGKIQVDIRYCLGWGKFPMAAWTAAEIYVAAGVEVGLSMTPVGKGRFEVYVDGEIVYNNKEHETSGITIESVKEITKLIKQKLENPVAAG